jgi:hypothetical protein
MFDSSGYHQQHNNLQASGLQHFILPNPVAQKQNMNYMAEHQLTEQSNKYYNYA